MTSPGIHHSLLRIDRVTGEPPAPFERPNEKLDFWVLELPNADKGDIASWYSRVSEILKAHAPLLSQLHSTDAQLALFIETAGDDPVFRLEAAFLKMLADFGISLEHHNAPE
ncbi:MAG: hypothetical protein PHD76_01730 [Methylacidiphilales bacterium]|nr:hypothetical protein [Candidatus Methylacidiphilales bacterium]